MLYKSTVMPKPQDPRPPERPRVRIDPAPPSLVSIASIQRARQLTAMPHPLRARRAERKDPTAGARSTRKLGRSAWPLRRIIEERARRISPATNRPTSRLTSPSAYRRLRRARLHLPALRGPRTAGLNLSPGLDFETRIVAKVNAAERLREGPGQPGPMSPVLVIGTATDARSAPSKRQLGSRAPASRCQAARHPSPPSSPSPPVSEGTWTCWSCMRRGGMSMCRVTRWTADSRILELPAPLSKSASSGAW